MLRSLEGVRVDANRAIVCRVDIFGINPMSRLVQSMQFWQTQSLRV